MLDPSPCSDRAFARIAAFFEGFTAADVAAMDMIYAPEARFKDPFNEVQGTAAIARVYAHMFEALREPRFLVTGRVVQGREAFLTWDFSFRYRRSGRLQRVRGVSHLVLDDSDRIILHRDYWDAAEEVYEKLPVLGRLMRLLKRRASAEG